MKDLLHSRAKQYLCPICKKQLDQCIIIVNYNRIQLEVCKTHIKYGEEENEQKNSSIQ